jgi:hypothetical protein
MIGIASFELCKELSEISAWSNTEKYWYQDWLLQNSWKVGYLGQADEKTYPAYDLGYLLRKLPKNITEFWGNGYPASPCLMFSGLEWVIFYQSTMTGEHNTDELFNQFAETPEEAACLLALELFKQGVLKKAKKK